MHPNEEISVFFVRLSPPFLGIYYVFAFLFEEKIPKICIRNDKKMVPNCWLLQRKIILKIQLIENKEVTLFVQLNW